MKRAHARAVEPNKTQTGRDELPDYAGSAVRELAERFGTEGGDTPELLAFLREHTDACLQKYGN
jgi:hypothetical protein